MKSNKIKIQMKLNTKKNLIHKTNNIFCPTKQNKNIVCTECIVKRKEMSNQMTQLE